MKFVIAFFVTLTSYFCTVQGMDCTWGTSKNAIDKFIHSCPRPIIDTEEEKYCCYSNDSVSCCNFVSFVGENLIFALPYIIGVLIISCICSCICCLCCRRGGGRVYRRAPAAQHMMPEQRIIIVPAASTAPYSYLPSHRDTSPPEGFRLPAQPMLYAAQ